MDLTLINFIKIVILASANPPSSIDQAIVPGSGGNDDGGDNSSSNQQNTELLRCPYCNTSIEVLSVPMINKEDPQNPIIYYKNLFMCPNPVCTNHEFFNMQHGVTVRPNAKVITGTITNNPVINATKTMEIVSSAFFTENSMFDYSSFVEVIDEEEDEIESFYETSDSEEIDEIEDQNDDDNTE